MSSRAVHHADRDRRDRGDGPGSRGRPARRPRCRTTASSAEYLFDLASGASVPNTARVRRSGRPPCATCRHPTGPARRSPCAAAPRPRPATGSSCPTSILAGQAVGDRRRRGQGLRGDAERLPLPLEHRQRVLRDRVLLRLAQLRLRPVAARRASSPPVSSSSCSRGSCGVTANQWVNVASVVDGAAGTASLYIDGVRIAHGSVGATPAERRRPVAEHHRPRAVARPALPGRALVLPRVRPGAVGGRGRRRSRRPTPRCTPPSCRRRRRRSSPRSTSPIARPRRHRPAHLERPGHLDLEQPRGRRRPAAS